MSVKIEIDETGPYFLIAEDLKTKVRPEFIRRFKIGFATDILARAIGFKKNQKIKVLDLSAGLCRDSYHFACLRCQVTALERHPDIFRVVDFYVKQLPPESSFQLVQSEAASFLNALVSDEDRPDVIYYDPMFPEKKKSAKVGKESELLQQLAHSSSPQEEASILTLALQKARRRVVVKRPVHAPLLSAQKPSAQFKGKAVRFDVYVVPGATVRTSS